MRVAGSLTQATATTTFVIAFLQGRLKDAPAGGAAQKDVLSRLPLEAGGLLLLEVVEVLQVVVVVLLEVVVRVTSRRGRC